MLCFCATFSILNTFSGHRDIWIFQNFLDPQIFKFFMDSHVDPLSETNRENPLLPSPECCHGWMIYWKSWKKVLKEIFSVQDVLYNMYCNAAAVLKIYSVNKWTIFRVSIPRYVLRKVNALMQKAKNVAWWSIRMMTMIMMTDTLRSKKICEQVCRKNGFCNLPESYEKNKWAYC